MKIRSCIFQLTVLLLCICQTTLAADSPPTAARNPFTVPDEFARTQAYQPKTSATPGLDLRATMITKEWSMANVNGTMLMPGETINGYRLLQVFENEAVFMKDGRRTVVTIDE